MKKPVILTIAVIYIVAIVVVGFIGIRMKVYNQIIYVDSITCISDNYKPYKEDSKEFKEEGYNGYIHTTYTSGLRVLIKFKTTPDNATNNKLEYIYDKTSIFRVLDNEDGSAYVEFLKPGTASITVKAQDSSGKKIKIKINAVDLGDII